MRLGEILVRNRFISPRQVEEAIELQRVESKRFGEILIERGIVRKEQVESALKEQYWRRNGYWVINN
jgi:hypothetical protein